MKNDKRSDEGDIRIFILTLTACTANILVVDAGKSIGNE
jgi:hypothetical protein